MDSPNPPRSAQEMANLLVRSQLLTAENTAQCLESHREMMIPYPVDLQSFSNFLVSSGIVTSWQVEHLRAGRWKGFLLGDVELQQKISQQGEVSVYQAKRIRDGAIVQLRVFRNDDSPGGIAWEIA